MLKTYLSSFLFAGLFAVTSVYANDPADSHEGAKHPAHEMGESKDTVKENDKSLSKDAKENKQKAEEADNAPHPAHQMDETEELQERGQ